jgi:hypothetical protein
MKILWLLPILFWAVFAYSNPKVYMTHDGGFLSEPRIIVDGVEYTTDSEQLADAFKSNNESYEMVQKYQSQLKAAQASIFGGLGLALGYALWLPIEHFNSGIYWGIFCTGLFSSVYYRGQALSSFYKAINIYNGVSVPSLKPSVSLGLISSRPGVSMNWVF